MLGFFVIPSGFEPETYCLEGSCSIQLSYGTLLLFSVILGILKCIVGVAGFEPATSWSQTRRDNRATLHPESKKSGETGTRTLATVTRRQISNLLRYHSGTSPFCKELILFCGCKCIVTIWFLQLFFRLFLFFCKDNLKPFHCQYNRN